MNKFQEALEARLARRLQEKRVVVWYDTDREFGDFIAALKRLPSEQDAHEKLIVGGVVARLTISNGSLFGIKLKIDSLVSGDKPEPLLVYLPGVPHSRLGSPLMEIEKAGDLLHPQKVSLERLAREELATLYTQGQIDEMLTTTSLTYLDVVGLFELQESGGSASLLKLVLGEGNSSELLATWLASDTYDQDLTSKGAVPELFKLVASHLELQIDPAVDLGKARRQICRYVLVNEFRSDLAGTPPPSLSVVSATSTDASRKTVRDTAKAFRQQDAVSYAEWADLIQTELQLDQLSLDPTSLAACRS